MREKDVKKLIIHCSASQDSLDIGAREIKILHMLDKKQSVEWNGQQVKGKGWTDIGYHYVIRKSGMVDKGRPLDKQGAHVRGHNGDSIGICWVGLDDLNAKQLRSLKAIVKTLMIRYKLDIDDVFGHYEFDSNKTCPNLDMNKFRAELLFK